MFNAVHFYNKHFKPWLMQLVGMSINFKKAKLGAAYCLWDGEELLEASIKSIRENVDYIVVVWSNISYFGEQGDPNIEKFLSDLKEKHLIDEIILYKVNLNYNARKNELIKRNIGLKACKKSGCSHFLIMDTDEFYEKENFKNAKNFIYKNSITNSYCIMYNYLDIEYRDINPAGYFVPFIQKINRFSKINMRNNTFTCCYFDSTRKIDPVPFFNRIYFMENLIMHHYTGVRKNIMKKLVNSSANLSKESISNFLNAYDKSNIEKLWRKGKLVKVENIFDIKL